MLNGIKILQGNLRGLTYFQWDASTPRRVMTRREFTGGVYTSSRVQACKHASMQATPEAESNKLQSMGSIRDIGLAVRVVHHPTFDTPVRNSDLRKQSFCANFDIRRWRLEVFRSRCNSNKKSRHRLLGNPRWHYAHLQQHGCSDVLSNAGCHLAAVNHVYCRGLVLCMSK